MNSQYLKSLILVIAAAFMVMPALAADYPINFSTTQRVGGTRTLESVDFVSSRFGTQTLTVGQNNDLLLYHDLSSKCIVACAGETVKVRFNWSGTWMHGYVYLDRDGDGAFSSTLGDRSEIPDGSDVMAFSNYGGYNSAGVRTYDGNVGVDVPPFTIPADLKSGVYRMRFKIDWNSIDPGGNTTKGVKHNQTIVSNSGSIADVTLLIVDSPARLTVNSLHGKVTDADGENNDSFAAGNDYTLKVTPDEGYVLSALTVHSSLSLAVPSGYSLVTPLDYDNTTVLPGVLVADGLHTIPAAETRGDVDVTADYVAASDIPSEGEYESNLTGTKSATSGLVSVGLNGESKSIATAERHYILDHSFRVEPGATVTPVSTYKGGTSGATEFRFYVDYDRNGAFVPEIGECVAAVKRGAQWPSFVMPASLPAGVYRARIEAVGDCDVDFFIAVGGETGSLKCDILNGLILDGDSSPLPNTVTLGQPIKVKITPVLDGFEPSTITVRHGFNIFGPQFVKGNKQWEETEFAYGETTEIPGETVDGDLLIKCVFNESDSGEWTAIWSDEFDAGEVDATKWNFCQRYSSTWNKRIAEGDEIPYVNRFFDGYYNSYAIATPDEFKDTESQNIITGAMESAGLFSLRGGRIEAKIRSRAHTGNFPAFWLMPSDGSAGWPNCGEIDIWEQIDASTTTYHTIHSAWTYKSFGTPSRLTPTSSGSTLTDAGLWHVYALEWEPESYLRWYVDGVLVFNYVNQHFSEGQYTEEMTWPFNKDFYVIINQSVGDGSWAKNGDDTFEYLTEFDYVRCYQKKDAIDFYINNEPGLSAIGDVTVDDATDDGSGNPVYYNLQGLVVDGDNLLPGVYIEKRGAKTRKILVK